MKKFVVFILLLIWIGFLPGYSLSKSTKLIVSEIQKLTQLVKEMEKQISSLNRKVEIIDDKVSILTQNQADFNQNRERLNLSLQFIKEEINELKNKITKINDGLLMLSRKDIQNSGELDTEEGTDTLLQSPENIYYTSYSDYLKKNYDLAIKGFTQFIRLFPQNGLSDNSLYWIGECYYAQKMYREAANTFDRLILQYSDGDKISAAMLKKGFALIEMGKQGEGAGVLKELISKFPLSEEASLAQQKIQEIQE
jgi:tol-pal system protein YbgF